MSLIQKVGVVAKEALSELNRIQTGEKKLLKTGLECIDCHIGGLLAGDVCVISGNPGSGKSEKLYKTIDSLLSKEVNPDSDKYVSLEYSLEMAMLNKMLRATNTLLNKKKSEILSTEFTDYERAKVNEYYKTLKDNRRYVVQKPLTPEEFYDESKKFCEEHSDKEAIIISADHLLLYSGADKQKVLEKIIEFVNLLKLEFNNVYFILLSQLNRAYNAVIKESSNEMIPTNSQLYGSSFMEQIASYIIILVNPYKLGVNQYLKVSPDRYEYLSEFYGEKDAKGKVSFNTLGNLWSFVTKTRESDNPWKDMFIERMDLSEEQLTKMKQSVVSENKKEFTVTDIPTFPIGDAITKSSWGELNKDDVPF